MPPPASQSTKHSPFYLALSENIAYVINRFTLSDSASCSFRNRAVYMAAASGSVTRKYLSKLGKVFSLNPAFLIALSVEFFAL